MKNTNYVCPYNNHYNSDIDFIGDPNGEPFVVQASTNSWIPISVVIYAESEEDALLRVKNGLKKIMKIKESEKLEGQHDVNKAKRILEECEFSVSPFDKRYLAKAFWAGNEYLG